MGTLPTFNINNTTADNTKQQIPTQTNQSEPQITKIPKVTKDIPQVPLPVDLAEEINQAEHLELQKEKQRHENAVVEIRQVFANIRKFEVQKANAVEKAKQAAEHDLRILKESIKSSSLELANEIGAVVDEYNLKTEQMISTIDMKVER